MARTIAASFWQFDGSERDAPSEVTAMPARITVDRNENAPDGLVMIAVRGRPRRLEPSDSVWLELRDTDALALVAAITKAIADDPPVVPAEVREDNSPAGRRARGLDPIRPAR